MTREQIVARARSAIGHGCKYKLGQGGMKPYRTVPWDDEQECDCSGFFMWGFNLSRFQPERVWYDTTKIVADARAGPPPGLFISVEWLEAQPGDGLAWPDRVSHDAEQQPKHHEGHCGIVTEVGAGPLKVVHCSLGNWKKFSDAIQETDATIFASNRAIVARLATSPEGT